MSGYLIGVDVGGTFTDLVLVDPATATLRIAKTPSTVADQAIGFRAGLTALEAAPGAIGSLVHGTTVGTNAVLERKGAVCGLITTRGFRDVLELGRRTRPFPYGMIGSFEPLISREFRFEVTERVDADGAVLTPLATDEVRAAVRRLLELGADALVIHFLHSYLNPEHERQAVAIARSMWPNEYVTAGSDIMPEYREFERGTVAALNAYLQPKITRYIGGLNLGLKSDGLRSDLLVMQGNGGMLAAPIVGRFAAHTLMSGPAAGAIAAARIAVAADHANVISCDMGGTSFDVCLIRDGQPTISNERDLGYGVPVRLPMVDIHTIGSGGGSIARVDASGLLRVGPESAGATPGPIGFGLGGQQPTVSDANLLLGRLNPAAITGSAKPADLAAIRRALTDGIGARLGLDAEAAAAAILRVANNQMASAIHLVSVGKGCDPRDFALLAFGGAGPLHATALARELGLPRVIAPRYPGITSALGCVLADVRHDFVQTINRPLQSVTGSDIDPILRDQARAGRELITREGIDVDTVEVVHEFDLMFQGQTHLVRITAPGERLDVEATQRAFASAYRARFDIELPEMRAMLINVRTTVWGRRPPVDLRLLAPASTGFGADLTADPTGSARAGVRRVWFEAGWVETPIYRRESLAVGAKVTGPAIVEQLDATTTLEPDDRAIVDQFGNLIIDVGQ